MSIEHSEIIGRDNSFDNRNYRTAEARIEYILKGGGEESYRPLFTFQGFRYARVTVDGKAEITSIASVPITSVSKPTASFVSGHSLVNRLVENTIWSQRSNFIEVPTDRPQRDERLGWTGDAQVFAATACYLHDFPRFPAKMAARRDGRPTRRRRHTACRAGSHPPASRQVSGFFGSTGWGDAICIVPWTLWLHYGDRTVLEDTLPAMVRWVDFVWSISEGPIVRPPRAWGARGFTFGDWLQPKGPSEKPLPTIGDDAAATIYLFISSALTAKVARVLGDEVTAKRMADRAGTVKEAFAREFMTPSGRLAYDDQTSYALAILNDLIPAELLSSATDYFKATIARADGRIGTGFIGTPALLPALLKIGEPRLAAEVFLQEEVPGWLFQVRNGATTIWERWDAIRADGSIFEPAMNSYNHYAYGAVCQWLFEAVAGFRPDEEAPGFRHIIFEPTIIPELSPVNAHHEFTAGCIEASWTLDGDRVTYRIVVPSGASGTLMLDPSYTDAALDGAPLPPPRGQQKSHSPLASGNGRRHIPDRCAFFDATRKSRNPRGHRSAKQGGRQWKSLKLGALALFLVSGAAVPGLAADAVTLTMLHRRQPTNVATAEGLKTAFEAENADIKIEIETHPGGTEGDNLVKTRSHRHMLTSSLQCGSLRLQPPETMSTSTEAFQANVIDLNPVVSSTERLWRSGRRLRWEAGLYKKIMPTSVSRARILGRVRWPTTRKSRPPARHRSSRPLATPGPASSSCWRTITTYRPRCPTLPKNTLPTRPSTLPCLRLSKVQRQEEVFKAGYLNEDFAAAKFDDGLRMVATGEGAHYPMLVDVRHRRHHAELSRQSQGCRFLRSAWRRRCLEWADGLDACRRLHRQDYPASGAGKALRGVHREHQGMRCSQRRERSHRPVPH